nr:chitobiase/beta-hexosaminidase C-terminal domain-containing protein [uncultured Carboxylicivirga sp.]
MKKSLLFSLILLLAVSLGVKAQNLVTNPSFENWEDANTPTGWDKAENLTQESTIVKDGQYSVKQTAGTKDIMQVISVEEGKSYVLSYYYLDNDVNAKSRIWSTWRDAGNAEVNANNSEMKPNSYSEDNAEWQQFSAIVKAPAGATSMYLEVRSYNDNDKGGVIYYDNFILEEYTPSVEAPVFSPIEGVVFEPQTITITSATNGASIYYTLDGTTPTDASTLYTAPFEISATTVIKAIAYNGDLTSPVKTATYTFPVECASIAEFLNLDLGTLAILRGVVTEVTVNPDYNTVTSLVVKDVNDATILAYGVYRISDVIYEVGQTLVMTGLRAEYQDEAQMSFSANSGHSIVVDNASGIEDGKTSAFTIAPNPFTTEFKIDGAEVVAVKLYNAAGQLVKNVPVVSGAISTSDLDKGMYILQAKMADGTISTQKVIKK